MFDLSKITLFNPALIYAFDPEGFPDSDQKSIEKDLAYFVGQYEDMFNGYLHAQTLVEWLRQNSIQAVTNEQFINWIKELHQSMGATLLSIWRIPSGEFTEQQVVRWNVDADIGTDIIYFFSEPRINSFRNKRELIAHCIKTYHIDEEQISPFIDLVEKFAKDFSAEIDPSQKPYLDKTNPNFKGREALYKLIYAYQQSKLTEAERKSVEGITRVCLPPRAIPEAINEYANVTLSKLKACDPRNLDEVAGILAESFYQLTQIHPFANANGRVATGQMNILLVGFGYPSILLRHPGDKEDPSSDYSKAISKINETREPLKELIKKRVIAAQQKPFSAQFFEQLMNVRCQLIDIQKRLKQTHPQFILDDYVMKLMHSFQLSPGTTDPTRIHFEFLTFAVKHILMKEKELNEGIDVATKILSQGRGTADPSLREKLKSQLHLLTGKDQWFTSKNGMGAWYESTDQRTIDQLFEILQKTNIGEINKGTKVGTKGIFCITCKNINAAKLAQCIHRKSSEITKDSFQEESVQEDSVTNTKV